MQKRIDSTYEVLSKKESSSWGEYNGSTTYGMLTIPEGKCFKAVIQQLPPEETEAYGVDIGCGNFELVIRMVEYFNAQNDIRPDITVHIIGIRGEGGKESIERIGRCVLYKLTVKIENLVQEFARRGIFRMHLGISRWALRHFNDPVGVYVQILDLLAKKGIFIFDGFFFLNEKERVQDLTWLPVPNGKMLDLVVRTRMPFLMQHYDHGCSLNRFILQRPDDSPCQLDMNYLENFETDVSNENIQSGLQVGSGCITRFDKGDVLDYTEYFKLPGFHDPFKFLSRLYGDKGLYDWLRENRLINLDLGWCGTASDAEKRFKLHQEAHSGNLRGIEELLAGGDAIDEADSNGYTPLHIAMKEEKMDCFNFLLEREANSTIPSCVIGHWQGESSNSDAKYSDIKDFTLLFEAKAAGYNEEYIKILQNLQLG